MTYLSVAQADSLVLNNKALFTLHHILQGGVRDRKVNNYTVRAGTDLYHFTSERFHYVSKTDPHHLHW